MKAKRSAILAVIAAIILGILSACNPVVNNTACLLSGNTTCYK